jgi:hypothetical protein
MSWFRLYVETMDDPKVMQLDPKVFRAWVICLCLAKEGNAGYGVIPPASVVAFKLHVSESAAAKYLAELVEKQLIDVSGNVSTPHNWNGRQYQSDVSTTRVQRFRNKQSSVSGNANETFQKPPQSTEYRVQSTEHKKTPPPAHAKREFEPFDGSDPTSAVHAAIEECAQFWPNIGDKRFAKATWEREASRSTKGAEAWCMAIVATARTHAEALVAAKIADPRKFIPTLDKWVSSGDYTSPPPMVISSAKKASRYELPEDSNAN